MPDKKKKEAKRPSELVEAIVREAHHRSSYDTQGSWTGNAWDDHDVPVQDADDL